MPATSPIQTATPGRSPTTRGSRWARMARSRFPTSARHRARSDPESVVAEEELRPLFRPRTGQAREPFKIALPRGPGREVQQHGRWRTGLVAEPMDAALRHMHEITGPAVDPAASVVDPHHPGQDIE